MACDPQLGRESQVRILLGDDLTLVSFLGLLAVSAVLADYANRKFQDMTPGEAIQQAGLQETELGHPQFLFGML